MDWCKVNNDEEYFGWRRGSGVWIGARATILLNTVIGDGAAVAACACVTRDIPGNTLAGGVPARVIKELEDGPAEHFQE